MQFSVYIGTLRCKLLSQLEQFMQIFKSSQETLSNHNRSLLIFTRTPISTREGVESELYQSKYRRFQLNTPYSAKISAKYLSPTVT